MSGDDLDRVLGALRPDVHIEGGTGTAVFEPQPEHRGNPGWLHGGLAATVLDHVLARTAAAVLGERVVTGTLDLRYPAPVHLDAGPYQVRAEAGVVRGRMVRVAGAIVDRDGRPMVEARALFVTLASAGGSFLG